MFRFVSFAIVAFALVLGVEVSAKPPSGPPPTADTGTIYYRSTNYVWWSMGTNGAGKTPLAVAGTPTRGLHEGVRWFLSLEAVDGSYPDGATRHELFATDESGTVSVQLTDAAAVEADNQMSHTGVAEFRNLMNTWQVMWATEDGLTDGKVSYLGWEWGEDADGNDVVVGWGVYVLSLTAADGTTFWDDPEAWVAAAPDLLDDVPVPLYTEPAAGDRPDCMNSPYCWSPDGERIAWSAWNKAAWDAGGSDRDLWVATPGSDDAIRIYTGGAIPDWSSGGKIAFSKWTVIPTNIMTINPDGTGAATLVTAPANTKRGSNKRIWCPRWSPSATHLIYGYSDFTDMSNPVHEIYRVTSSGSGAVNLTADQDAYVADLIWRP